MAADMPCHPTNVQRAETTRRGKNSTHRAPEGLREAQRNTRREVDGAYKVRPPFFVIFYYSAHHTNRTLPPPPNTKKWACLAPLRLAFRRDGVMLTTSNPPLHRNARRGVCSPTIHPLAHVSTRRGDVDHLQPPLASKRKTGGLLTYHPPFGSRFGLPQLSLASKCKKALPHSKHETEGAFCSATTPFPSLARNARRRVAVSLSVSCFGGGGCFRTPLSLPRLKHEMDRCRIPLRLAFRCEGVFGPSLALHRNTSGGVPYCPPSRVSTQGRCLDHPWPIMDLY